MESILSNIGTSYICSNVYLIILILYHINDPHHIHVPLQQGEELSEFVQWDEDVLSN